MRETGGELESSEHLPNAVLLLADRPMSVFS